MATDPLRRGIGASDNMPHGTDLYGLGAVEDSGHAPTNPIGFTVKSVSSQWKGTAP
jgi:hypothetical protein